MKILNSIRMSLMAVCICACFVSSARAASSVSQYGITWTFSTDRTVGQFVNGDWWVIGPVTVTSITPAPVVTSFSVNGSMINPIPGQPQGLYYDSGTNSPAYAADKNVAMQLPVTIQPENSLYSTINNPNTWTAGDLMEKTWFKETAVLTILSTAPPAGSFRPPYAGANKTIKSNWNVSKMNYSALRSLVAPNAANVPSRVWLENATQRPLLEMHYNYLNSQWKASWAENKDGGYPRRTYGREISHISSGAGLFLQTNVSNATKERLLINMCQWGIDIHGLINNGMQWQSNGGHNLGRFLPLYIAAKVLGDGDMLIQANGSRGPFQEFQNHYFILQSDIDRPRATGLSVPAVPYTQAMLGMPEWSSDGRSQQERASSDFWADPGYRYVNGAPNCAVIATVTLMGGRTEMNQEAYYRYITERYYPLKKGTASGVLPAYSDQITFFTRDMWETYIAGGTIPPVDTSTPPSKVTGVKVVK
ncbi:MAG: hypothetical protein ABIS50_25130 [Luteolibacter sp.]|uniref:hypothetical protein n=1 Tax=Luteolibacter sp. TaxID=1962973 RepID=UPI0032672976